MSFCCCRRYCNHRVPITFVEEPIIIERHIPEFRYVTGVRPIIENERCEYGGAIFYDFNRPCLFDRRFR